MQDLLSFLKPARTKDDKFYFMTGDQMVAGGGMGPILAGCPAPTLAAKAAVPADELERALSRMEEGLPRNVGFADLTLTLRSQRARVAIRCTGDPPPMLPELAALDWRPVPPGLVAQLEMAALFTGEMGWSAGVRLMNGQVTAMGNMSGIDIDAPGLEMPPSLVGKDVIEFLEKAGQPAQYAHGGGSIAWRWPDGRWMRNQLLSGEMPEKLVGDVLASAGVEAPVPITRDAREAFEDAAALSGGQVRLSPDGFHAAHGAATGDVSYEAGLLTGHSSFWRVAALEPVFKHAERWAPERWPEPARFEGRSFRGVVLGVRG